MTPLPFPLLPGPLPLAPFPFWPLDLPPLLLPFVPLDFPLPCVLFPGPLPAVPFATEPLLLLAQQSAALCPVFPQWWHAPRNLVVLPLEPDPLYPTDETSIGSPRGFWFAKALAADTNFRLLPVLCSTKRVISSMRSSKVPNLDWLSWTCASKSGGSMASRAAIFISSEMVVLDPVPSFLFS